MVNIAVLGYGTVGSGVVEVVDTNGSQINQRIGEELNIKYVLDFKDFPGNPVQEKIVHDFETIINDDDVQIVVEVLGGIEPAYTFVKRSLQAGKSAVTSNKALVAKHGAELLSIAKEHNINFLFEASVGGGIPIIRPLNSSLTADEIEEITGILNGTTNYMMTEMSEKGADFDEVLKEFRVKLPRIKKYYEKDIKPIHIIGKALKENEQTAIKMILKDDIDTKITFGDTSEVLGLHAIKRTFESSVETSETKFIRGNLRSGQREEFSGSIAILGDLNYGAEVIAGENIIVTGKIRGLAHAGANGNKKAIQLCASPAKLHAKTIKNNTRH